MLLHDLFAHSATQSPDHIALVSDGQRHSFRELLQRSQQLAAALRGIGLQRGDRVALFMDNRVEMAATVWAVLQAGGAFMPINPLTKADKLAYMLNDARARVLITQDNLRGVWRAALAQNTSVDVAWVCGLQAADGPGVGSIDAREHALPAFIPEAGPDTDTRATDAGLIDQDLAAIIYTSGSTGDPKGVMLSHLNMVSACTSVSTYLGLRGDDTVLCALPLAFDYGLYQLLMCARVGATLVLERSFTFPVKVLEVMVRERVTVFPGVPTMFAMLMNLQTLPSFDLGHLRMITNTAAALSEAHIQRLRALFPQATLFSMSAEWQHGRVGRAGKQRHAGLLGQARGHGSAPQAGAGHRRPGRRPRALHRRSLSHRQRGLPLFRGPQGRHHQKPWREGQPQGSRERAVRHRRCVRSRCHRCAR
jgi:long-chain acyl-CoA synthetase